MVVAQSAGAVVLGLRIAWHRAKRSRTARHRPIHNTGSLRGMVRWHDDMFQRVEGRIQRYKGKRMGYRGKRMGYKGARTVQR